MACHMGVCVSLPMKLLMNAFLWHTLRETMPNRIVVGHWQTGSIDLRIFGTKWPDYGFDEWFLLSAVYPRLALEGLLTFKSWKANLNHWFALDIEYVTWANPKSEIVFFGEPKFLETLTQPCARLASSAILPRLLSEKLCIRQEVHSPSSLDPLTLVVARYNEDLNWLHKLPPEVRIMLYNKGVKITDPQLLRRIDFIETITNRGKEADTYLHHLENSQQEDFGGWTVFCQGDPFPHSPDFLKLLGYRDSWEEVQPLTSGYMEIWDVPPRSFKVLNDEEWIGRLPVYTEQFSLHTMEPLGWIDEGANDIFTDYRKHFGLEKGWSIAGHFLESCGLEELAEQAWRSSLGQFSYGAQFGVRNDRLSLIPKTCLALMREVSWEHYTAGFVYERMWLHLFGIPFTKPPRVTLDGTPIAPRDVAL